MNSIETAITGNAARDGDSNCAWKHCAACVVCRGRNSVWVLEAFTMECIGIYDPGPGQWPVVQRQEINNNF